MAFLGEVCLRHVKLPVLSMCSFLHLGVLRANFILGLGLVLEKYLHYCLPFFFSNPFTSATNPAVSICYCSTGVVQWEQGTNTYLQ